jgi:hypothetical protein
MFPEQVFNDRLELSKEIAQLSLDQKRDNAQILLTIISEFERSLALEQSIVQRVRRLNVDDRTGVEEFYQHFADYVGQRRFNLERTRCGQIRRIYEAQISGTGAHQPDPFDLYDLGLKIALRRLEMQKHLDYNDALVYEQRLRENLSDARLYGDTDTSKADRARIIARLNELALAALGESFNDLCQGAIAPPAQAFGTPVSAELQGFLARFADADREFTEQIEPVMDQALSAVEEINSSVQAGEIASARQRQERFAKEYAAELKRLHETIDEMNRVGNELIDRL